MSRYVLKPAVVELCMWAVATRPTHRHLPGYLGLKRTARIEGKSGGLDFDYTGFYDAFLRVRDDDNPYLTPFGPNTDPDRHSLWFNSNVAGTYAPSSIRPNQPFSRVVTTEGSGHSATYALVEDHHEHAREELLQGQRLPVVSLSVFLYRDFAVETDDEPSADDLVTIFRDEFGYRSDEANETEEFEHLYETGGGIPDEGFRDSSEGAGVLADWGETDLDDPFEEVEE